MNAYQLILGFGAFVVLAFAIRWQFDWTMDKATNADQSGAIPVSTPFKSPLCGHNNRDCINLGDEPYFNAP